MDSKTTQGTSRASMIILATVVFPEALPPPRPAGRGRVTLSKGRPAILPDGFLDTTEGHEAADISGAAAQVLDGRSRLTSPSRRGPRSPMAKASLDCVPCSLYQGGRPAV